jgi:hypothetical protein
MEKNKKPVKSKKGMFDGSLTTESKIDKIEVNIPKKKHKQSYSNIDEFAFGDKTKQDSEQFANIYDGKFIIKLFLF